MIWKRMLPLCFPVCILAAWFLTSVRGVMPYRYPTCDDDYDVPPEKVACDSPLKSSRQCARDGICGLDICDCNSCISRCYIDRCTCPRGFTCKRGRIERQRTGQTVGLRGQRIGAYVLVRRKCTPTPNGLTVH